MTYINIDSKNIQIISRQFLIIAAEAAVQSYATTGNLYLALLISVIFGVISALLADFEGHFFNSGTDSHIDPPAFAIFIMTFVVNACFPV